jgi:ATPase subunit of ABC transporter with duplicated ATPase domains
VLHLLIIVIPNLCIVSAQPFINEDTAWANIRSQFDQLLQESIRRALELQTAEHEATAADYEKAKTELRQTQTVLQRAEARANALQQRIAELEKIVSPSLSILRIPLRMHPIASQAHDATRQTEKVQAENTRLHDLVRFDIFCVDVLCSDLCDQLEQHERLVRNMCAPSAMNSPSD